MTEVSQLYKELENHTGFAIYGAQVVAYGIYTALKELQGVKPECFIVSSIEGNPTDIEGITVYELGNCRVSDDILILIAVTELLQDEICNTLKNSRYSNYICIGTHEEHLLMSAYFERVGKFPLLSSLSEEISVKQNECSNLNIGFYTVTHHTNKPLKQKPPLNAWDTEIQAGAAQSNVKTAQITDDTGDNISQKNLQYAEATAIYWVWKNTTHVWKGIGHYRRKLVISDEQTAMLNNNNVDAILPLPYVCYPNALAQYKRFVSEDVADLLLSSLKKLYPSDFDKYMKVLNGKYTFAYNLFAAQQDVFDKYCSWMFSVLQYMELFSKTIPELETTRALAYSSEILTSLFFLTNINRYRIYHTEKCIYV